MYKMENGYDRSFLDYYSSVVSPRLMEIDIVIKCKETLGLEKAAFLLDISRAELENILHNENLENADYNNLIFIMKKGSSRICRMLRKEYELGSPFLYSVEDIAYIYEFDILKLKKICDSFQINEITWQTLPIIFSFMPVYPENYAEV